MMTPPIKIDDLPRPWRAAATFGSMIVVTAGIVFLFLSWVRAEARAEAKVAVQQTRAEDVAAYKLAALEAATAAAAGAIRESVAPVLLEMRQHIARDEQGQHDTDRRIEKLEDRERERR